MSTHVPEASTHDDGLVTMLLVVVEDLLDGDDSRILITFVGLSSALLVPIENSPDERRNQGNTSLGASNGLAETEKESQVAVDVVIPLQFPSGLDTLPGRSDLDEDTVLVDTEGLVEGEELLSLGLGGLLVEGKTSIDFGGDTARDDFEDLLAELDELRHSKKNQDSDSE